jgi:tRNA threonylcarbamoyladenosine biosynthesis protein TsaE
MISNSVGQTYKIAQNLLPRLVDFNLICLYGDLGSGKTTFVQGLSQALGIKKRILSPTFVILREYKIKNSPSFISHYSSLVHIDCYRIKSENNLKSIDLKELWSNPANLVIIEWAERIKGILPNKRIDIKFSYISEKERKIEIIS